MSSYWRIDGVNDMFRTLWDAKYHIWHGFTPRELRKYLNYSDITHYVNHEPVSYVRITIKNEKIHYSKIKRL